MGVHSLCDTRHSERSFVANNLTKGNYTCLINSLLLQRSAADQTRTLPQQQPNSYWFNINRYQYRVQNLCSLVAVAFSACKPGIQNRSYASSSCVSSVRQRRWAAGDGGQWQHHCQIRIEFALRDACWWLCHRRKLGFNGKYLLLQRRFRICS